MNVRAIPQGIFRSVKRRPVRWAVAVAGAAALLVTVLNSGKPPVETSSYYEVRRGDFLVSVVEGGTLEAVNEVEVRSEVEGTARIIYIVPEGSYAHKGDLLVELDSSNSEDAVNLQQINVEKAQFSLLQAEQQLDIQKSVVDSEVQTAALKMEFAESDLEKFAKGQSLQAERNAEIEITNVLENLQIAQERLDWSEKLYKEGFETKGNLDKDRLAVSQSRLRLEQTQRALWMLKTYDNPKNKRALEATLQEAKENLDRVKLQGERKLAQFSADVDSQKRTLELSQAKLDREKQQLEATKIYAPQDGLVVYGGGSSHWSSESLIEEGAVVRNRQEIIKLPDVTEMKLRVKIHESHINQLRIDQPAYVVLDSMPEQRFQGKVSKVAPLPDSQSRYGNPDLKVYATEILVTDKLPDVKPGVSARAEIIITNLTGVLSVPIQAVTTRKGKQVVFLASAPDEPVPVNIGLFNTKFLEICGGVKEGDRVLLAPPLEMQEKDLGGAIIADGESLPAGATNQTVKSAFNPAGSRPGAPGHAEANKMASAAPRLKSGERVRESAEVARGDRAVSAAGKSPEPWRRFDKDGDGKLSESELAAMQQASRRRGTNGPARTSLLN